MFFSEEKNQKTLASSARGTFAAKAHRRAGARHKSLLVLFFRKEHLAL
jgi:hypothetical protein